MSDDDLTRSLKHELGALRQERRLAKSQQAAASRAADDARLHGTPFIGAPPTASIDRPNLAGPLMSRLRADSGFDDANSGNLFSTNMLKDPLMETILPNGQVPLSANWTPIGKRWEARKRSVSGNVPTVTARRTHNRKLMEGHIYRSDIVAFDIEYAGVGECWVELRPSTAAREPVHIEWPWCVAAARIYVDKLIRAWDNLDGTDPTEDEPNNYVRMVMVDGGGGTFEDPDFEGDEADLESLSDDSQETQVYVGSDTLGVSHWMAVQVHTLSLGAGGICVAVAEPQINYAYQEAPMPYEPAVGNFDPQPDEELEDSSPSAFTPKDELHLWAHVANTTAHSGTGTSDHGALTGLVPDDDHTQYALGYSQAADPGTPAHAAAVWYDTDENPPDPGSQPGLLVYLYHTFR